MLRGCAVLLCAALAPSPAGALALQAGLRSPVDFAGKVVDTYEARPVAGALVRLVRTLRADGSAISGITDAQGRFSIPGVPPGPSEVEVSRIGYAPLAQVLDIAEGQFVEVAVIPKPVVLETIEVYVDRLETRLRALPHLTTTFGDAALRSAPDLSVADYLHGQPGFEFVPCFDNYSSTSPFGQRLDCIRARGTMPQRPRIFIDDAPAFGGVEGLATLPTTDIYRIEFIRGCGQIRVYTNVYVEGAAPGRAALIPIVC